MKNLDLWTFIAGFIFCFVIAALAIAFTHDLTFAGLCVVATAILYSHALEKRE